MKGEGRNGKERKWVDAVRRGDAPTRELMSSRPTPMIAATAEASRETPSGARPPAAYDPLASLRNQLPRRQCYRAPVSSG